MDPADFTCLLARLRHGDEAAAARLVQCYEPIIRREIRFRLRDSRLRRALDSTDVCQSVLASFFIKIGLGDFEFETPEDLAKLLAAMARRKLFARIRHERQQKRDHRRSVGLNQVVAAALPATESTPSQIVAGRELLDRFRSEMDPTERRIADGRSRGVNWKIIARQERMSTQACRARLSRAVRRISRRLGLEND